MIKGGFLLLLLCCVAAQQVQGQNSNIRNAVKATYDIDKASKEIKEYAAREALNREKAYSVANERDLPIQGEDANGNYFELSGIDERGLLYYKKTFNIGSRKTARVDSIAPIKDGKKYLEGEGMLIGLVDGMPLLDTHQEFYTSNQDTLSRAILKEPLEPLTPENRRGYSKGRNHATHVGGTLIALGMESNAKGVVPKAKLWSYSWIDDYLKMAEMASAGLLVSNHSYGYSYFDTYGNLIDIKFRDDLGAYSKHSREFDRITVLYPYYLPVLAAGNEGEYHYNTYRNTLKEHCDCDMMGDGALAKNVVTVAAVEEVSSYTGAMSVKIADFSSQGPSNDFRIKPDISAKGVDVYSTMYMTPIQNNKVQNNLYFLTSGTSQATPSVTGVFALWQEWAVKYSKTTMPYQSATIRALMAHTADEAGKFSGPDHIYGWGLINARAGIDVLLANKDARSTFIEENILKEGEKYVKEIHVTEEMSKLVVTLAWTDPEGVVSDRNRNEDYMMNNPSLVNDLNIVVKKENEIYYPWKLNKDFNDLKAIKGVNDVDTIEKIEIQDVVPGKYTIEITHAKRLKGGHQKYALITTVGEFDKLRKMKEDEEKDLKEEEIKVWPNPVESELYIEVGNKYNNSLIDVLVFDLSGKLVSAMSDMPIEGVVKFDMNRFNTAVYTIEVKTFDSSKVMRIVKK